MPFAILRTPPDSGLFSIIVFVALLAALWDVFPAARRRVVALVLVGFLSFGSFGCLRPAPNTRGYEVPYLPYNFCSDPNLSYWEWWLNGCYWYSW